MWRRAFEKKLPKAEKYQSAGKRDNVDTESENDMGPQEDFE